MINRLPSTITPDTASRRLIEEKSRQSVSSCYQCGKCTSGCPITFAMDLMPHQLVHLLQLGQVEKVLQSDAMWICASCVTCTSRCPNGIDIAGIMDTLRQYSEQRGIRPDQQSIPAFHKTFMDSIRRYGRVHEMHMAIAYTVKDSGWLGPLKLAGFGLAMFMKGKTRILPSRVRGLKSVRPLFLKAEHARP